MSDIRARRAAEHPLRLRLSTATSMFAGSVLVVMGLCELAMGIAALNHDEIFLTGEKYTFQFDLTTWGWIHIVVAVLGVAIGLGILANSNLARFGGVCGGGVNVVVNFLWLPQYPVGAIALISFSFLAIWALAYQMGDDRDYP